MPPIKPNEVKKAPREGGELPEWVFDAFNELIQKKWDGRRAYITLKEACDALIKHGWEKGNVKNEPLDRRYMEEQISNNGYADVEEHYRAAGWTVKYDQPMQSEASFEPHYIFSRK